MVSGSFGRRATLHLYHRAMVLAQAWIMLRFRFQHHCCEDQKFHSCFIHIRDYFLFYHIQFIHYLEEQIEFTNDHLPVFCQASRTVPGTHFYTWVKRDNVEQSFLSKETTRRQRPGSNHRPLDWKSNVLTTRPPRLHNGAVFKNVLY